MANTNGTYPCYALQTFGKSTTQKMTESTSKILSVQLENSISPLIFNELISILLVSKSRLDCALFKIKEILEIRQKAFVLLLIKRRTFFGTAGKSFKKIVHSLSMRKKEKNTIYSCSLTLYVYTLEKRVSVIIQL